MSRIGSKNTKPELFLRSLLHREGMRFRLHSKNLPGKPDMVFSKYRAVIFINGCFWHYHGCKDSKLPSSRSVWWRNKLKNNQKRDNHIIGKLLSLEWRVLVIWECSIKKSKKNPTTFIIKIRNWLSEDSCYAESKNLSIQELSYKK